VEPGSWTAGEVCEYPEGHREVGTPPSRHPEGNGAARAERCEGDAATVFHEDEIPAAGVIRHGSEQHPPTSEGTEGRAALSKKVDASVKATCLFVQKQSAPPSPQPEALSRTWRPMPSRHPPSPLRTASGSPPRPYPVPASVHPFSSSTGYLLFRGRPHPPHGPSARSLHV
jgi:hypothetical protein